MCCRTIITKRLSINFERLSDDMSYSSTTIVGTDPDVCGRCNNSIHYPCEVFRMVDCPRCGHDVYECGFCGGRGESPFTLEDGTNPTCVPCNGRGELRGCATCRGTGSLASPGHDYDIECGDCAGQGWKPCKKCDQRRQVKRLWRLCPGDTFRGLPRKHVKPSVNPREDEFAKEDWGEMVLPYDPLLCVLVGQ